MGLFHWGKKRVRRRRNYASRNRKESGKSVEAALKEKSRINRTLKLIRRERLNDEMQLLSKQISQLQFLKKKMTQLRSDVGRNCGRLRQSIDNLKKQRDAEKVHIKDLMRVRRTVEKMDVGIKNVSSSRKGLIMKEEKLITNLDGFVRKNTLLHESPILSIMSRKKQLLSQTNNLINKQLGIVFADKKAIQEIIRHQRNIITKVGNTLHERLLTYQKMSNQNAVVSNKEKLFDMQLRKMALRRNKIRRMLDGKKE